jgi:hypothetical protein
LPQEREYIFHPNMLQLQVGGRGKPTSHQLSWLQTDKGGDAGKEATEDTQGYNRKVVPFQPHHDRLAY